MRQNWERAYAFLTQSSEHKLTVYAQENDPLANLGEEGVTVSLKNVVKRSENTYQLEWIERRYLKGVLTAEERWTGVYTIKIQPPANREELLRNPLGLRITDFVWSREYSDGR